MATYKENVRGEESEEKNQDAGDASSHLRHRKVKNLETKDEEENKSKTENAGPSKRETVKEHVTDKVERGTFWLTRIALLRSLAFVYAVAFLCAYHQNKALIGKNGLLPANVHMQKVREHTKGGLLQLFLNSPTLLWFVNWEDYFDDYLNYIAITGLGVSILVVVTGAANMIAMTLLWLLYHSIINVGQRWYGFGWESQLVETGFLAIFFCPVLSWRQLPRGTQPSWVVIWGYRWLIFRIMMGAGLIKIRGDKCWMDLTCMNYFYETQPNPNPLSYYYHQLPVPYHKFEVLSNHFVELIVPWFVFLGRRMCLLHGILQIIFQVVLISAGNLSFLNWLTIIPSISCFDDAFLARFFPKSTKQEVIRIQQESKRSENIRKTAFLRRIVEISVAALIAWLSIPVVRNLFSTRQAMNTSFDPFRIVNTYGAFGSITKLRTEIIFQGTYATDPMDPKAEWLDYEFKCKPGDLKRTPCVISPYHYRLDWLMWFAAFQNYQYNPWLVHIAMKMLVNDELFMTLISHNPFKDKDPPRYVRAQHFVYHFTKIGSQQAKRGEWYTKKHKGSYLPPVNFKVLVDGISQFGWPIPEYPKAYYPQNTSAAGKDRSK